MGFWNFYNKDRRKKQRHSTNTRVFIRPIKQSKAILCRAITLSETGATIKGSFDPIQIPGTGFTMDITFVVTLGKVAKMHPRNAKIIHYTNGVIGVQFVKR